MNTMIRTAGNRWLQGMLAIFIALAAIGCAHDTSLGQKVDGRGQVQLSGFVKSVAQTLRAMDLASRVDGVNRVLNRMTITSS